MAEEPRYMAPVDTHYDIAGLMLDLAAVNAWKNQDGKDTDGQVEEYAKRFLQLSLSEDYLDNPKFFDKPVREKALRAMNRWVYWSAPVLHGMKVATAILGPKSKRSPGLHARIKEYEDNFSRVQGTLVEANLKTPDSSTHRWGGLSLWEKVMSDLPGA
jgi:hypothetical protein